jgi:hypothetical protein
VGRAREQLGHVGRLSRAGSQGRDFDLQWHDGKLPGEVSL